MGDSRVVVEAAGKLPLSRAPSSTPALLSLAMCGTHMNPLGRAEVAVRPVVTAGESCRKRKGALGGRCARGRNQVR